jgi:arsenate reductase
MGRKRRVLFLCTGNSARSQMAEGWLRHLGGDDFEAFSAGTDPKGVNPLSVQVMQDVGVDLSGYTSKHLETYLQDPFDFVITVCDRAKEHCPIFPGDAERLHWSFDDPADPAIPKDQQLQTFRRVRDEIKQRITEFLSSQRKAAAASR